MTELRKERRQAIRIRKPFDACCPGIIELPLRIYDLSLGGCLVNSFHTPPVGGKAFTIEIDLGAEGTMAVEVETTYVLPGFGYGVRFREVPADARRRLECALDRAAHEK